MILRYDNSSEEIVTEYQLSKFINNYQAGISHARIQIVPTM